MTEDEVIKLGKRPVGKAIKELIRKSDENDLDAMIDLLAISVIALQAGTSTKLLQQWVADFLIDVIEKAALINGHAPSVH